MVSLPFGSEILEGLVRRLDLLPTLCRRMMEEEIVSVVPLSDHWYSSRLLEFLNGEDIDVLLEQRQWTHSDLELHIRRPEALKRFALQRFGPGLEEYFLSQQGQRDRVIYSFLRVKDPLLLQELWIRIEEGETTFSEAASLYSEGPERAHKGLIGPLSMASVLPVEIPRALRRLQPGQVSPPARIGDWYVLLRLEQLVLAKFDSTTREQLLSEQLNTFLVQRVKSFLSGEPLEPLQYDGSV
jgi:hypothetical protein